MVQRQEGNGIYISIHEEKRERYTQKKGGDRRGTGRRGSDGRGNLKPDQLIGGNGKKKKSRVKRALAREREEDRPSRICDA